MLNICNEYDDMQIFKQNVFTYGCVHTPTDVYMCVYIYM